MKTTRKFDPNILKSKSIFSKLDPSSIHAAKWHMNFIRMNLCAHDQPVFVF